MPYSSLAFVFMSFMCLSSLKQTHTHKEKLLIHAFGFYAFWLLGVFSRARRKTGRDEQCKVSGCHVPKLFVSVTAGYYNYKTIASFH